MNKTCIQLIMGFVLLSGCNEPDTIVTNIVNPDGSVTRRVEMRSSNDEFLPENNKVPVDSTWMTEKSIEVSETGDTTWIVIAEKIFPEPGLINSDYIGGGDANAAFSRSVTFRKSFRWFNTVYRFSESIDRYLPYGYPLADYVKGEALDFFLQPDSVRESNSNSSDSLYYRALEDTLQTMVECWVLRGLIDGWMKLTIVKLNEADVDDEFMNNFPGFESIITECSKLDEYEFDDVLLRLFGEETMDMYGEIFKAAEDSIGVDYGDCSSFNSYTVRTIMPGTLIKSNGYVIDDRIVVWPAKSELFMFEDYEMWAESRISNSWAWILTILIVLAVPFLITLRRRKK